jgi:hypothetical protein
MIGRFARSRRAIPEERTSVSVDERQVLADLDDDAQLDRLSAWVGAWDPCFSLARPPGEALLYEPDGTLYAVGLGTPMTISLRHRDRQIRGGDIIVVPPALALEVEPKVDFLALRCDGTVPDHFREPFLQVWGYDHFPANLQAGAPAAESLRELIPASDLRFQASYAIWELPDSSIASAPRHTGYDLDLLLGIDGPVSIAIEGTDGETVIPGYHLLGLGPQLSYRGRGPGRLGCLRLSTDLVFQTRRALDRARRGQTIAPGVVSKAAQSDGS